MIIDFHTHAFPDKIAPKAIESLKNASALEPYTDGTIDGLKKSMEKDGVDISVVLGIAKPIPSMVALDISATIFILVMPIT